MKNLIYAAAIVTLFAGNSASAQEVKEDSAANGKFLSSKALQLTVSRTF